MSLGTLPGDAEWMGVALEEASLAGSRGEVPVGAVVVLEGRLVSRGHNCREANRTVLGHAEVKALHRACRKRRDWRLDGATVYVTLEPCPMCIGAMLQARVARLVYGAVDPRAGCAGSIVDLADYPGLPHHLQVVAGVRASESRLLLEEFFLRQRAR